MIIDDKPNLERIKRALETHIDVLSKRAISSSAKPEEYYAPEIEKCEELIKNIDANLSRIAESITGE